MISPTFFLLTAALHLGCSTREIEQPAAPPTPPTAALWPLGGKIYYGTPIPEPAPPGDAAPAGTDTALAPTPDGSGDVPLPTEDLAADIDAAAVENDAPDGAGTTAPLTEDPDASEPAPGDPQQETPGQ